MTLSRAFQQSSFKYLSHNYPQDIDLIAGYIRELIPEYCQISLKDIPDISTIVALYFPRYRIFGIGQHSGGELGLHTESVLAFTFLNDFSLFCDSPTNISAYPSRFVIQTLGGEIYVSGRSKKDNCRKIAHLTQINQQMNEETENDRCLKPNKIQFISSGISSDHTFIYTKEGTIFVADYNFCFTKLKNFSLFFLKLKLKIKQIACNDGQSLFLTTNGKVFDVQEFYFRRENQKHFTFHAIPELVNISKIVCGNEHAMAIDINHKLYVFGINYMAQLGVNPNEYKSINVPLLHPFFSKMNIIHMYCGLYHSLCIDDSYHVYTFGWNKYGQIGNGSNGNLEYVYPPYLLPNILCNDGSAGAFHNLLLCKYDNNLYAFGNNHNSEVSSVLWRNVVNSPYLVTRMEIGLQDNDRIIRVIAGHGTSIILVR